MLNLAEALGQLDEGEGTVTVARSHHLAVLLDLDRLHRRIGDLSVGRCVSWRHHGKKCLQQQPSYLQCERGIRLFKDEVPNVERAIHLGRAKHGWADGRPAPICEIGRLIFGRHDGRAHIL